MADASSIAIIGGADGPTAIFLASQLSPDLLGAIAVAAYSYMALVPIIQPPIMKALTTPEERKIKMAQLRHVGKNRENRVSTRGAANDHSVFACGNTLGRHVLFGESDA